MSNDLDSIRCPMLIYVLDFFVLKIITILLNLLMAHYV